MRPIALFAGIVAFAAFLISQPSGRQNIGRQPDGSFLLNSGWKLRPAGTQIPLDTLPMSSALTRDGKFLLILNGGYRTPSISVLDVAAQKQIGTIPLADAFLGITIAPDGRNVYVGGGSRARVYELGLSPAGKLSAGREFLIAADDKREHTDFTADVAMSPDGHLLYAGDLFHDSIVVINPQSGRVIERWKTGRRPYRILFHPDGKSFFVSSWADGSVYHHDANTGEQLSVIRLGSHTTDMVFSNRKPALEENEEAPPYALRLFVTASNTNSVYVVGINDSKDMSLVETINVAMTPRQPVGMTPTALGLSPDQTALFIACSDANAVAVADVSGKRTRVHGFIPTAWYPTAARVMSDGQLWILNGRGPGSYANPEGPGPIRRPNALHGGNVVQQYVGRMQVGSASVIAPFTEGQLSEWTKTTIANSPYRDALLDHVAIPPNNPVPDAPGKTSPIQHVLYIVKENRTYDQVFGDLGKGNGDASLTLFKADSTPNQRKLANEFVLFDNFYVNSDVSADGHNWATAAIAPDYVVKMWPNSYGQRRKHYDYEGGEPANTPPAGYLWTNALAAGLSVRNYGYFVTNRKQATPEGDQVQALRDPALNPLTNRMYRGFDLEYPDTERARVFLDDLKRFEATGAMPRLMVMRLGNDHTSGTSPGKIAPLSAMADNDYALGMIVEGLSKSRFWAQTAVFVVEDDAQNGPDHVDSHRSPAFAISPFTHRGIIDSTMYNQTSVLRTMELILGLRPMTQFDAGSIPMWAAFADKADAKPYQAEKPSRARDERNAPAAPQAARSARMDFSEADQIDDDELNAILWRAIRGTDPPAPVASFFAK